MGSISRARSCSPIARKCASKHMVQRALAFLSLCFPKDERLAYPQGRFYVRVYIRIFPKRRSAGSARENRNLESRRHLVPRRGTGSAPAGERAGRLYPRAERARPSRRANRSRDRRGVDPPMSMQQLRAEEDGGEGREKIGQPAPFAMQKSRLLRMQDLYTSGKLAEPLLGSRQFGGALVARWGRRAIQGDEINRNQPDRSFGRLRKIRR